MLAGLPQNADPNLLVGFHTRDDAAVYRITDEIAVVSTTDFITPPVDDPFTFGRIAAANALSDVFAMGGRPTTALQIAGFPGDVLGLDVLAGIFAGSVSAVREAGAVVAGGHTTRSDEPLFGLAVNGLVHPERIWTNAGAQEGDALIFTKRIGSGVLLNADRKGWVSKAAMDAAVLGMSSLNRVPAEVLERFDVHACTDVTGFGLAGHALEMAVGAGVALHIDFASVPLLDEAREMYGRGMNTGSNAGNRALVEHELTLEGLDEVDAQLLFDPQTSGGLLVALPESQAQAAVAALRDAGVPDAVRIGTVRGLRAGVGAAGCTRLHVG